MNGSAWATGGVALLRGAMVAVVTGLVVGLSSYLQVSDDCPSGQVSAVKAEQIQREAKQAGKSPAKALKQAQAQAKTRQAACVDDVDDQQNDALLAGLLAFASALGIRGFGEGAYDARRQLLGNVGRSDVQPDRGGRHNDARDRAALEARIDDLERRTANL
jgi:hypothetical protein